MKDQEFREWTCSTVLILSARGASSLRGLRRVRGRTPPFTLLGLAHYLLERCHQLRTYAPKLFAVTQREFAQGFLSFGRELQQNLQPVCEFHRAVMLNLQPIGDLAHAPANAVGKTFQRQHELILLRLQSRFPGRFLAEAKKTADLIPKFGHALVVGLEDGAAGGHRFTSVPAPTVI